MLTVGTVEAFTSPVTLNLNSITIVRCYEG